MDSKLKSDVVDLLRYAQAAIGGGYYVDSGQPNILDALRFAPLNEIGEPARQAAVEFVLEKLAPHPDPLSWIYANAAPDVRAGYDVKPISLTAMQAWNVKWIAGLLDSLKPEPAPSPPAAIE